MSNFDATDWVICAAAAVLAPLLVVVCVQVWREMSR